ncbi:Hypothetical predicted protein [Octopus vulgaris]|uniref:Uncharacterized protein n=1 Tax=Octopus vulgaris TaxID=6645 RepID=A0AA36APJ5_OCTVU|nr:Hypothetical predicted protein [Octopus vulgaris]
MKRILVRHLAQKLTDVTYADDLILLSNSTQLSHSLVLTVQDRQFVNPSKTKFIAHNQQGSITNIRDPIIQVDDFTYLGFEIASIEMDVKTQIAKSNEKLNVKYSKVEGDEATVQKVDVVTY